nr:L-aminoadipate-semialdehyde dehydrogenase-phosphopantetheinyl transferase-like [Lepeophtheirus salmonis]
MSIRWAFDACTKWRSPSSSEWTRAMSALSDESERARIRKFHYQSDAKSALVGRLLLEKFSKEYLHNHTFQRSSRGRPEFQVVDNLSRQWDFNISHQGSYVAFVAERRTEMPLRSNVDELACISSNPMTYYSHRNIMVGVDVMRTRIGEVPPHENQNHFFNLMRRQFSEEEWKTIKLPPDPLIRSDLFYRHWCLKESFVKALGVGLTICLKSLSFEIESELNLSTPISNTSLFIQNKKLKNWTFQENRLDLEHTVCVALSDASVSEPTRFYFFEDINDIIPEAKDENVTCNQEEWLHFSTAQTPIKPF